MRNLIISMRPRQWVKNGFVFAALLFSTTFTDAGRYPPAIATFVAFCLLCSSMYLLNDVCDRKHDRHHPLKKHRPIARGDLAVSSAAGGSIALAVAGLLLAAEVNAATCWTATGYLALTTFYSAGLKRIAYLDIGIVAFGFVLRALAGAYAIRVYPSPWLLACTFLLAVFLVLNKRLHELSALDADNHTHRPALAAYSKPLLTAMIWLTAIATISLYTVYVIQPSTVRQIETQGLVWTIPFVIYGMGRYAHLSIEQNKGGTPTETFLTDWRLLLAVAGWVATVCLLVLLGMAD